MTPNVCFMTNQPAHFDNVRVLLARCGLTVWTSASADAHFRNPLHAFTACLIVDMPGLSGLEQLESLRARGISTPTILMACAEDGLPTNRLGPTRVLDVLERPLNTRRLLAWIEVILAVLTVLVADRDRKAKSVRSAEALPMLRSA